MKELQESVVVQMQLQMYESINRMFGKKHRRGLISFQKPMRLVIPIEIMV